MADEDDDPAVGGEGEEEEDPAAAGEGGEGGEAGEGGEGGKGGAVVANTPEEDAQLAMFLALDKLLEGTTDTETVSRCHVCVRCSHRIRTAGRAVARSSRAVSRRDACLLECARATPNLTHEIPVTRRVCAHALTHTCAHTRSLTRVLRDAACPRGRFVIFGRRVSGSGDAREPTPSIRDSAPFFSRTCRTSWWSTRCSSTTAACSRSGRATRR